MQLRRLDMPEKIYLCSKVLQAAQSRVKVLSYQVVIAHTICKHE